MSQILEDILETYPDYSFLKADGFDEAIVGVDEKSMRLVYSVSKCIDILMRDGRMEYEDALDYFNFNVSGAYVGEQTPIWLTDNYGI